MRMSLAAAALLATLPAAAQIGNPAGMAPATPQSAPGKPAPGSMNTQDRLFVQLFGAGGRTEIDAAQLAAARGRSDAVKAFAQRMAADHRSAGERLGQLASAGGVPMPAGPDPDGAATLARLQSLEGAAFDAAYVQSQVVDHQKAVELLLWELSNGQDPNLQRYAAATLDPVLDHLRHVQRLAAEVNGAGPQGMAQLDWRGPGPRDFDPERRPAGAR